MIRSDLVGIDALPGGGQSIRDVRSEFVLVLLGEQLVMLAHLGCRLLHIAEDR
jgi:hypothetical protein